LFECLNNIDRYKIHGDVETSGMTLLYKITGIIMYVIKGNIDDMIKVM
jgi:type III secretory pathway component EscT